jgi:hypothetical protein
MASLRCVLLPWTSSFVLLMKLAKWLGKRKTPRFGNTIYLLKIISASQVGGIDKISRTLGVGAALCLPISNHIA